MKVLHVVENFGPAGLENVVKNLVLHSSRDFSPLVCVLNSKDSNGQFLEKQGFTVWELNWKEGNKGAFSIVKQIAGIVRQERIDIVHAHNYAPLEFCCFAACLRSFKLMVTFHGFITWRFPNRYLYPIFFLKLQRVVVVSPSMVRHYLPFNSLGMNKLLTILNGIELVQTKGMTREMMRHSLGLTETCFAVGSIGRISPIKNHVLQIEAIALLKDRIPGIKLLLVTSASPDSSGLMEALTNKISELKIVNNVMFLGTRNDVGDVLRALDAFVNTSFSEGTSLAILEAMAAGVAVVASRVGGTPDIIDDGKNGFLFDVHSAQELADRLFELHGNRELRVSFSSKGNEFAGKLTNAAMAAQYENLYAEL